MDMPDLKIGGEELADRSVNCLPTLKIVPESNYLSAPFLY